MKGEYAVSVTGIAAEIFRRTLREWKSLSNFSCVARCDEHFDSEAVGVCKDCRRRTCQPCQVEIRRLGTFCTHCALVRAGIRR
jgi:hypothetical protein